VQHVPTAIILQFVTTFCVWMLAERIGLSGVLTMVCYASSVARTAPERIPARIRIPTYAVWETVVFALNILAFIFIGLQIRPILASLAPAARGDTSWSPARLLTVIVVRLAWHMSFNAVDPMARPPVRIPSAPTDAAADRGQRPGHFVGRHARHRLARRGTRAPRGFPYRDLIVLTRSPSCSARW
jgi:CPA1 family monovalent cation:H+ antiporter